MPKLISTATTKMENEFMTLERYWKSVFYFGQRLQQKYIFYDYLFYLKCTRVMISWSIFFRTGSVIHGLVSTPKTNNNDGKEGAILFRRFFFL